MKFADVLPCHFRYALLTERILFEGVYNRREDLLLNSLDVLFSHASRRLVLILDYAISVELCISKNCFVRTTFRSLCRLFRFHAVQCTAHDIDRFLLFLICFFAFKGLVVRAFQDKSPLFVNYIYFALPIAFFMLYMTVFETNATILERVAVPRMIREVFIRVSLMVGYLLYGLWHVITLDGLVVVFCATYGIGALLNLGYLLFSQKISFKPDFRITREHGQWFEALGRPAMALYHPSALLRDPSKRPETFVDLKNLQQEIQKRT